MNEINKYSRKNKYDSSAEQRRKRSDYRDNYTVTKQEKIDKIQLATYRREFSKLLDAYPFIIEDVNDFWLFVSKYESFEQNKGVSSYSNCSKDSENDVNDLPVTHDPAYFVNVTVDVSKSEIINCVSHKVTTDVANKYTSKFLFLISLYISFKQKEKLEKLIKVRDTQKNLPVTKFKDEILEAISKERVVIIAGDTGCGKSTQIPQYLIQAGYKQIACTQPRRIACISLSKRVACEMLSEYNSEVGYQIRFEKNRNADTKILFITEGLLLRQVSDSKALSEYDIIVLDEVHERHLYGDFLLGIMKCLLYQKSDLKIILMSATINIELFENYFGSFSTIIQVPGRLYPIKVQYHPISQVDKQANSSFDPSPYIKILNLIDHKYPKDERGDVLMFLNGVKEITSVVDAAELYNETVQSWCILPLHSSLSLDDQNKVFDYPPEGFRKCVVATNIAETSITIDGIRFVVDSGKVNEISYDSTCKMSLLKEFWISRASAEQRKGRAGRTGPGVCFRLYSEEDYAAMLPYTIPEIQRVPLDSILLQMIAFGLPNARKFPFIEPPSLTSIETSILNLKQYNAITDEEKLTEMGKTLSKLPVDIPLGKMLIMGTLFHQVESILSLASVLSVQSPYTHAAFRDLEMQELRKEMESDWGDPITLLNIFREWLKFKNSPKTTRNFPSSKRWCKKRGLEEQRFYEMTKLRSQFKDLLLDCKLINEDLSVVKSEEEMTHHERILRHGELSQLRKMKRALTQENTNKPKILKTQQSWEIESDDLEIDHSADIKDVEFRLQNNPAQVQHLLKNSTANTHKDVSVLKVVLCSSIYPQIAIPDEFNSSNSKMQLFHTVGKSHIALHPNSYFSLNPRVIQVTDEDTIDCPPDFKSKLPISSKHQILFYMSLLETTKPYLVNVLRMPAAQSLLLFCNTLHTNGNFTRIICDRWIELKFISPSAVEIFLLKIVKIRSLWTRLLVQQLQGKPCGNMSMELTSEILQLLSAEIYYTMKRLLNADIKTLFVGYDEFNSFSVDTGSCNPFDSEFEMYFNKEIGGVQVTNYLTYNCLLDDDTIFETWECSECDLTATFTSLQKLQHKHQHKLSTSSLVDSNEPDMQVSISSKKSNSRMFHCDTCDKDFYFTPTEILRHKAEHRSVG